MLPTPATHNYKPPQVTGNYAKQQTQVVEDTMRTQIQAETTANNVLASMVGQKQQLQNANDDMWAMRTNVANAQRELKELQQKAFMKKQRLYMIIGLLSTVDVILFFRIVQCGGSFFCRRY
jgi:prophage DNA circulation protein